MRTITLEEHFVGPGFRGRAKIFGILISPRGGAIIGFRKD